MQLKSHLSESLIEILSFNVELGLILLHLIDQSGLIGFVILNFVHQPGLIVPHFFHVILQFFSN